MEKDTKVITLCGSMRYSKDMMEIAEKLELEDGYAVIQCVYNIDANKINSENEENLARLHRKKIDVSDAIYVVNINGYIGNSTRREIEYEKRNGKEIIYHEELKI